MDQQEKLQIVRDLVNIRTVNENERAAADYLINLLAKHGISANRIDQFPNRSNVVAEIGNGQHPKLGFSGHLDTVHENELSHWDTPPFEATIHDNRLYGRGTSDMKAGLAQFVITMIELHEQQEPLHGTIRLLATISEELTEEGAAMLSDAGYGDDLDAILFAEPTGVPIAQIDQYFASGAATISSGKLEQLMQATTQSTAPEQHFIINAHKGWISYTVASHGKAAHSSMPKLGINAIDNLVQYYNAEKAFYHSLTERHPGLGKTVYAPDVFVGGKQVNSIPDLAVEKVKVRTIPELSNENLVRKLRELIQKLNEIPTMNLELTVEQSEDPVANNVHDRLTKLLQHHAATILDEPLALPTIGSSMGTDASEFRRHNPDGEFLIVGPGNTTAHQANEYVEISSFLKMQTLFATVAINYLQPD
ncbi:M20/M25/M40 family metallo-hydrolase [Lentilactobacillus parafarraginis]|jgi:succinyl-diaminopimelate desuccinylase|uniref:Peptidase dimerization domain protein n=2 Tax=Lentilactobacillus parafarraginis TaxID=390842 RepID=A0A0R1YQ37_9LACO|nr:M20/M25/M40 family metallo-hydrolase [Lentilactobacillus parafarraginis]KRM44202.1 peptidase dimerization domain protein [Lentilactobacillus parafarraginis DSM 18390 = JCM 14109]TLQ21248.1 M20/M25/M40 family metallo-hydrolase [Lentilactobacillus parafarraginis]